MSQSVATMLRAPNLTNDTSRLVALDALNILDTPAEERFDRLTRIASQYFNVPIALISLVDANRQWFKSSYGLDVIETDRDTSFCGHAIAEDNIFVVENATEDPRFADNPLVVGEPYIRFYAGQPLHAGDGSLVGTFCLIDRKPRKFDENDRLALRDFAMMAESELNLVQLTDLHEKLIVFQENEKKSQEERDRQFTNSLDLQCIARMDGYFHRINPMFSKTLGYTDEEILATPFIEFVHPDDRESTLEELEKLSQGQDVVQFENRYRCKDGTYRWFAWNTPAPKDDDQMLYAVARDITNHKAYEHALQVSEARFKTLVEHSPEAIVLLDLESGNFIHANQNALDLFQLDMETLLKRGPVTMSPATQPNGRPSSELAQEKIEEALRGQLSVFEWIHKRADGEEVPCEVRLVPLPGKRPMVRASITDISWRKETEAELRNAKEAAEAANRAKSDFLANMSHEIRTPMNAVIGMTEIVLDMDLSDEQRDYLNTVLESADSLMTIINEILDFSKIDAGKLQLENLPFSLRECLGDAMKSLALRAHSENLELAWHVNAEVPDLLKGDANRLRQIIVNLVGNGIKFTKNGEIILDVSLIASENGNAELQFVVKDTGIGIAADRLDAVFEVFQQADTSTTRQFGGTGLGLAISSRLVELMNGRIWVESEFGEGTTFSFTCVFELSSESESQPDVSALKDVCVLVVDDNATNRKIMNEILSKWGLDVELASDARQAMEHLRKVKDSKQRVELVITDLHMPEQDGFDLAREIRRTHGLKDTEIILLTSGASQDAAEHCQQLRIARHLLKPIKQSELLSALYFAADIKRPEQLDAKRPTQFDTLSSQKILLAEDLITNQKLAVSLLQRWGHEVSVANNGREALDALENDRFDLILMDVQMPEMDGLEATREIRRREKRSGERIPIIAMTAHAMTGDRKNCLDAGMDAYLSKPVRMNDLHEALAGISRLDTKPDSMKVPVDDSLDLAQPSIDWDAALEIVGGDRDTLKQIAEAAQIELAELMKELSEAVHRRDDSKTLTAAHKIQGTLRVFQSNSVFKLVRDFEVRCREGRLEDIDEKFGELMRALTGVLNEVTEFQ